MTPDLTQKQGAFILDGATPEVRHARLSACYGSPASSLRKTLKTSHRQAKKLLKRARRDASSTA